MRSLAHVTIHPSQFPENVRRDLLDSLQNRRVNHKFHYDSLKQTQKWLALHQAYSPSRTDPDCEATYERSFTAAAARLNGQPVHLIGLGCGGGQKDARLLTRLRDCSAAVGPEAGLAVGARGSRVGGERGELWYTPVDVSVAMVLVAREAAIKVLPETNCLPLVCDLGSTEDLSGIVGASPPFANLRHGAARLITCFGMLPNFEPELILSRLAKLLRPSDTLLLSANLAPGPDYGAGVEQILPLYDNALTRDWLITFLLDIGFEAGDGRLEFSIEEVPADSGLKRVAAHFHVGRPRCIEVDAVRFEFVAGEVIQLFFSNRHTPALVGTLCAQFNLHVLNQWLTNSGEEGVFLAVRR